ncbi:unnamed protein product [Urochloa humidicola]
MVILFCPCSSSGGCAGVRKRNQRGRKEMASGEVDLLGARQGAKAELGGGEADLLQRRKLPRKMIQVCALSLRAGSDAPSPWPYNAAGRVSSASGNGSGASPRETTETPSVG